MKRVFAALAATFLLAGLSAAQAAVPVTTQPVHVEPMPAVAGHHHHGLHHHHHHRDTVALFAKMDTNHDGKVTLVEARAWRDGFLAKRFAFLTAHKDGVGLDAHGLNRLQVIMIGKRDWDRTPAIAHEAMLRAMFDRTDTNHDGVVTLSEFKATVHQGRHMGHHHGHHHHHHHHGRTHA